MHSIAFPGNVMSTLWVILGTDIIQSPVKVVILRIYKVSFIALLTR